MPHSRTFALAVLPLCALLDTSPAAAGGDFSVTTRGEVRDCSDLEVRARGRRVVYGEEALTVPAPPAGRRLRVSTSRNGGIHLVGGAAGAYQVTICKAAVAGSHDAAEADLERIGVEARDGRLTVVGPAGEDWLAYLLVEVPPGALLEAEVLNGPLSLREASGDFLLRAVNGPIALRDTGGTATVEVRNGPVSIAGGSGRVTVDAQNGPISVELEGAEWRGEGLEARAVNGPLSLSLDEGYASGVVVETSGHSPWSCSGCGAGRRVWDDDGRRVEFGEGPVRVRLATRNGPVSVKVR
jgi:hypothetical protein